MKKIVLFILFVFLFIPFKKIKAINGYDLPINKDIKVNSVNDKYKWYKLKEFDSRNEDVFEHICEYLELKETGYSSWSTEKPEEKYGRIIEEKEEEFHSEVKYSAIMIDNILTSNLRTKEIKLYDDNWNEIKYKSVLCYNCTSNFPRENLFDNVYNTYFEIRHGEPITLLLNEETTKNVRVQFFYEKEDYLFGYRVSKLDNQYNVLESREENDSTLRNLSSPAYASYINSNKVNWSSDIKTKYYRYKDAYLVCAEKEYLDGYYDYVEDYIKDENQKVNYYDYDEVILEPEIVEKEVFKEIVVPKEKIVNKYITIEKEVCTKKEAKTNNCEYVVNTEVNNSKEISTKKPIKIYVVITLFLLIIVFLCLFLKELIKRCR